MISINTNNNVDEAAEQLTDLLISQLTVTQTLGEGAFGEVKLLRSFSNPSIAVAVKLVDIKKYPEQKDSVRREALLHQAVSKHKNVLKYIGSRITTNQQYQVFLEYADGGDLFDRIEHHVGVRPLQDAFYYFSQIIDGVSYIHSQGICHRDLKPENVLLANRDMVKICDFGMATLYKYRGQERFLDSRCGSLPYAAPEILKSRYRARPVDVWSCGVILVALLVGELPWEEPTKECKYFRRWIASVDNQKNGYINIASSTSNNNIEQHAPWKKINTESSAAFALLKLMLHPVPEQRLTTDQIQAHLRSSLFRPTVFFERISVDEDPSSSLLKQLNDQRQMDAPAVAQHSTQMPSSWPLSRRERRARKLPFTQGGC